MKYALLLAWLSLGVATAQVQAPFTKQPLSGAVSIPASRSAIGTSAVRSGPVSVAVGGTMSLTAAARVSLGVYNSTGQLIRTIEGNVSRPAGAIDLSRIWDGKDDNGVVAAVGSYSLTAVANNIEWSPGGTFGNNSVTSPASYTTGKHGNYVFTKGLVITTAGKAFQVDGYAEGKSSMRTWTTASPLVSSPARADDEDMSLTDVAEDGTKVYQLGHIMDQGQPPNFPIQSPVSAVRASVISTGATHTFSSGTSLTPPFGEAISVTAYRNDTTYRPRGIAVLRTGSLLFVAYPARNLIAVFDKNTGAIVSTQTVTSPSEMAVDYSDRLWVVGNNTVTRYDVNASTGALSNGLALSGLTKPMALAISKDNSLVAVCDGSTSQQVKFYNASTGTSAATLGTAGGYAADPTVNNSKFYFSDVSGGINKTFVAFAPDGSFWVGDVGNYRIQHYSAARAFVDRIAWFPNNYSVYVNQTDPTRVFAQYLEYSIDYTKDVFDPLAATLVRNWRASVPASYIQLNNLYQNIQIESALMDVTTLANGRTFALTQKQDKSMTVTELPASGQLRFTARTFPESDYMRMAKDGTLYSSKTDGAIPPPNYKLFRRLLTGYDGSTDPVFGSANQIHTFNFTATEPVNHGGGYSPFGITPDGDLITFDAAIKTYSDNTGYHLGLRKMAGSRYEWQSALSTHSFYQGEYPLDGRYDIGNGPQYGTGAQYGGAQRISIARGCAIWHFRGEFWKSSQTNRIHFVDIETGLPLGVFGNDNLIAQRNNDYLGNAGNVFYWEVVEAPDGNLYGYHGAEAAWFGIHRHKFTGFNTIYRQTVPVTVTSTADPRGFDILVDIPRNTTLTSGQDNIFRSPATNNGELLANSSYEDYERVISPGISLGNNNSTGDRVLRKTFPAGALMTGLTSWTMTLDYNFQKYRFNVGEYGQAGSGGMYFRVKDNAGKVLVQFAQKESGSNQQIVVNGTVVVTQASAFIPFAPVVITVSGSTITFKYGPYTAVTVSKFDNTADLGSPAAVELFSWIDANNGSNTGRLSTIKNVWFKPN